MLHRCQPRLHYGDYIHWATIITSTGALLGGLAIVIALIQLGNQREDRLRAQISKIGVWTQADDLRMTPDQPHCRNLLRHAAVPSLGKPGHE